MALLTKAGVTKILRRIMETGGLTDDMENDIKRLQDDFDEREGILKTYGETYDGEDKDEYDFKGREKTQLSEGEDYKGKYEEMKQKYLDRFFGGVGNEVEDVKEETKEDVKRDGTEQTFEDLFEKREG